MKVNIEVLEHQGTVKNYSSLRPGDSVLIYNTNTLLKPVLKNMLDNEKAAMKRKASSMNCTLVEISGKLYIEFRFDKNNVADEG